MEDFIKRFNSYFDGSAQVEETERGTLKLTIGTTTLFIELGVYPKIVGGQSQPKELAAP